MNLPRNVIFKAMYLLSAKGAYQQFTQIQNNPYLVYKFNKHKVILDSKFTSPWQTQMSNSELPYIKNSILEMYFSSAKVYLSNIFNVLKIDIRIQHI